MIYLIERPHKGLSSVSTALMGNFPVHCFASFQSFFAMIKSHDETSIVAIVESDYESSQIREAAANIRKLYARSVIVLVSCLVDKSLFMSSNVFSIPEAPADQLVFYLKKIMDHTAPNHKAQSHLDNWSSSKGLIPIGDNVFDVVGLRLYSVSDQSQSLDLTVKESRILNLLAKSNDSVLSREFIREFVWPDSRVSCRTIDSHISRLRKRIAPFGMTIHCQYGKGYQLSTDASFD